MLLRHMCVIETCVIEACVCVIKTCVCVIKACVSY